MLSPIGPPNFECKTLKVFERRFLYYALYLKQSFEEGKVSERANFQRGQTFKEGKLSKRANFRRGQTFEEGKLSKKANFRREQTFQEGKLSKRANFRRGQTFEVGKLSKRANFQRSAPLEAKSTKIDGKNRSREIKEQTRKSKKTSDLNIDIFPATLITLLLTIDTAHA